MRKQLPKINKQDNEELKNMETTEKDSIHVDLGVRLPSDLAENAEFMEWYNGRPIKIQELIRSHPPNREYRVQNGEYPATIHSYDENEDGAVTLQANIHSPFFPRCVFGLSAEDVIPWEISEVT